MANFNAANFYAECKDLFGEYASAVGYAKDGIDEVADLRPRREVFVATLLGDKALSEACHDDSRIYYYNVIRYCLTAGIEYGAQWQVKPEGFEEEGYDEILYKNNVGRRSTDITSNICESPEAWRQFLIGLHRVWSSQLEPYISTSSDSGDAEADGEESKASELGAAPAAASKEQSEAVLQSCFAVFQLGVAIALEKFDAPGEDAEAEEAEVPSDGESEEAGKDAEEAEADDDSEAK